MTKVAAEDLQDMNIGLEKTNTQEDIPEGERLFEFALPTAVRNSANYNGASAMDASKAGTAVGPSPGAARVGCKITPENLNSRPGICRVKGRPNMIFTTHFTALSWLPMSLYFQFKRVANIYFLYITIVVCLPFSPKDWTSFMLPFIGVLLWSSLKDAYEDLGRRREDIKENTRSCLRFNIETGKFDTIMWQLVLAGDIVLTMCDDAFPADLLLLAAAGGTEAFISTVNLDGETNLKEKRGLVDFDAFTEEKRGLVDSDAFTKAALQQRKSRFFTEAQENQEQDLAANLGRGVCKAGLRLQMAKPEAGLSEVRGKMTIQGTVSSGGEINFFPRGCTLRNTLWTLSVAVYVGQETKTRLNAVPSPPKVSNMQNKLNMAVRFMLAGVFITSAYLATMQCIPGVGSQAYIWPVAFFRYNVTIYHVVPISLYVVFEMLKIVLAMKVNRDNQMLDPDSHQGAHVRCMDLLEEIGQVSFVFSDKTGTLTANEMVFARSCILGKDIGDFRAKIPGSNGQELIRKVWAGTYEDASFKAAADLLFTCLAVCHAVQVQENDEEEHKDEDVAFKTVSGQAVNTSHACRFHYSGMSPDEVALVQAAADNGVLFTKRSKANGVQTLLVEGPQAEQTRRFELLREIEFNSDRKRMSIVAKIEDEIWCITKGADNIMAALLDQKLDQETVAALNRFSKQGLRTLVIAMKKVPLPAYEAWMKDLNVADAITDQTRNEKVAEVSARLEVNLKLVGVTAVEDRLQDGVPAAIATIKSCGVRVWVLTGDKVETAVDIARSCSLFGTTTCLAFCIDAGDLENTRAKLILAKEKLQGHPDGGVVLDGKTVKFALMEEDTRKLIYELGLMSRSCICCRLSPMQKKELVGLVRQMNPTTITLAIGDGANDVPMIEGAHIGIGIRGKEGAQAVQASDVAISQFRFLVPMMLCHGSKAYRRISLFLLWYLYKSVCLAFGDVIWAHQGKFNGDIAFPEYVSMVYSILFTAWHIVPALANDEVLSDEVTCSSPAIYSVGPNQELFNMKLLGKWMLYAVVHGSIAWLTPNLAFGGTIYTKTASLFWEGSLVSFTAIVIICNTKLMLNCVNFMGRIPWLVTLIAILMYFIYIFLLGQTPLNTKVASRIEGLPIKMWSDSFSMPWIFITPAIALSIDVIDKLIMRFFFTSEMDKAIVQQRKGSGCSQTGLPAGSTSSSTSSNGKQSKTTVPLDTE